MYLNRPETATAGNDTQAIASFLMLSGYGIPAGINLYAISHYAAAYYARGNCIKLFFYGVIVSWYEFVRDGNYCK